MKKKKIQFNIAHSYKEAEEFDIRFWRRVGATGRLSAAWLMVGDWLKIRGKSGRLPRLRRTLKVVKYS